MQISLSDTCLFVSYLDPESVKGKKIQVQIQIQIVYNDLELFISDNTHKLVLSMDPEAGFVEQEQRKFEDLEHKLRANLTQEEK